MPTFDPRPVTLQGQHATLEPLEPHHAAGLIAAAADDSIWTYLPEPRPASLGEIERWIGEALRLAETDAVLPFAIIERGGGRVAGSTRYLDIQRAHRGLEIGYTWLGTAYQRSALNTECKLLLLQQAFETLGAIRVQLKTDARNLTSQAAIERIGARREGVLRSHMIVQNGYVRDSVYYSIVAAEWPAVQARLLERLGRA